MVPVSENRRYLWGSVLHKVSIFVLAIARKLAETILVDAVNLLAYWTCRISRDGGLGDGLVGCFATHDHGSWNGLKLKDSSQLSRRMRDTVK